MINMDEWCEPENAKIAAFNERLFDSITSKHPVYDMAVIGGYGEDEINYVTRYLNLQKFVSHRSQLVFDGGVWAKRGGSSSGANCSAIVKDSDKALAELIEYAGSEETKKEAAEEFKKLLKHVKTKPGYVLVEYGVENDMSFLAIHKEDYKILNKFKPFTDPGDLDYWTYDTLAGKRICA